MSEPTPGPWILRRFPYMRELWVTDATPDRDGKFVGQIIAGPNTNPRWEANAVVIHAALDLLAACKLALSVGEALDRPDDANQRIYLGKSTIEALRAAVAKAEGITP